LLKADYRVMLIGVYQSTLYVVALALLTLALVAALYVLLGRRSRHANLQVGTLLGGLVALWVTSIGVPALSWVVTWPLLGATLPLAWTLLAGRYAQRAWPQVVLLSLAAAPSLILLPGILQSILGLTNRIEGLTGFPLLGALMLFVAPLAALLVPHLRLIAGGPDAPAWQRWAVSGAAALGAVLLLGWGVLSAGFSVEQPRPNQIAYVLNADTHAAHWVSHDRHLDAYTRQFFPAGSTRRTFELTMPGTLPAYVGPAPLVAVPAPEVQVLSDTTSGEFRTLRLRFVSLRGSRLMVADVRAGGEVVALTIDGRAVDPGAFEWTQDGTFPVLYHNAPAAGWELTLTARVTGPVEIAVEDVADGLPVAAELHVPPRLATMMPAPGWMRDPTIVTRTFRFD
jgi:hypothetical protein